MKVTVGEAGELECVIRKHDEFDEQQAQLSKPAISYWRLGWLLDAARCFVCSRCGYVHWFRPHESD